MLDLVLDLIWPSGSGRLGKRIADATTGDAISVESWRREAIKQALNESGWLGDEVIAAGQLRQGKAPSMVAVVTGWALVQLLRPRRSKTLPSQFVLAVTADRVIAFKASGGGDSESNYETRIKPGERGSWPRELVRLIDLPEGANSKGATLELAGVERIPVVRPNLNGDPSTDELFELLAS
jgi:hypothetical protein